MESRHNQSKFYAAPPDGQFSVGANRRLSSVLLSAMALACTSAQAADITVFSTTAAKSAMEAFVPLFERYTEHKVNLRFATAGELKAEIEKGAACDVALLTAGATDDLVKRSKRGAPANLRVGDQGR